MEHDAPELCLLEILKERSFRRGRFRLASGVFSDYYLDARKTTCSPDGAFLAGRILLRRLIRLSRRLEAPLAAAVGGMQVGAVPLATAVSVASSSMLPNVSAFWVRPAAKGHGTESLVEGCLEPGQTAVVLDDVVTTGRSTLKAADAVRAHGCTVVGVVALVDRLQGAAGLLARHGIESYEPVFTCRDFGVEPDPPVDPEF